MNMNSMLYWYPLLSGTGIPVPRTIIVPMSEEHGFIDFLMEGVPEDIVSKVRNAVETIGLACFLRTDYFSGKHCWDTTCFLEDLGSLEAHLNKLLDESICRDLVANAFVIREFLPLETAFSLPVWNNMPVAKERRYFVQDGEVACHHPYWDAEVFEDMESWGSAGRLFSPKAERVPQILPSSWRESLENLNYESEDEIEHLTELAKRAALALEGAWSVDFACVRGKDWVLIDCALAKDSWHPPGRNGSGIRCKLEEESIRNTNKVNGI